MDSETIKAQITELNATWVRLRYEEHRIAQQRSRIEQAVFNLNVQLNAIRETEAIAALKRAPEGAVYRHVTEREDEG